MLLEPLLIECPNCNQKYEHYTVLSSNTFGITDCWSDGYCGNLPIDFGFASCQRCGHVFWLSDANKQTDIEDDTSYPSLEYPSYSDENIEKIISGDMVTETIVLKDIKTLLTRKNNSQSLYYLYLAAIQLINNAQRYKKRNNKKWFDENKTFFVESLNNLILIIEQFRRETIDIDDEIYELEIEANRLAGNFEKAKHLMRAAPLDVVQENEHFFKKTRRRIMFRNSKVFKL